MQYASIHEIVGTSRVNEDNDLVEMDDSDNPHGFRAWSTGNGI
jgi:hypothetical protein